MIQTKLPLNSSENKDKYYLLMSNILINNPFFKAKIFEFFDYDIERVFEADKEDLKRFGEIYDNIPVPKSFLSDLKRFDLNKLYDSAKEALDKKGINYITYESGYYPDSLKQIEDFPLLLYYKGSFENINFERTLGIVGSRNATESARQNVRNMVFGFLNTDAVIVSGLASGIDTAAHKAALANGLKTIGVIGSGLNFKYPSQNAALYDEIEEKGLILSEYPNSVPARPVNFPQRNRIVTGLSKGVIIAEARLKSGAMISARRAIEQGRELMCIPGLITNPNCEGIYHLIKNGAEIVTKTEDILNRMGWEIKAASSEKTELKGIEKEIYDLISGEEISFEGLKQKLDVGINELMIKLTEMELSGLIIQKNGLYYILGN